MEYKDLKPSENNYNFNINVLEKVWLEKLKIPFSTKSMFKVLSGAKGFGKMYLICLLAWFFTVNFLDYNVQLAKYTFASAKDSYYSTMTKVINDLVNHGVTINEAVEAKAIKSFNSENRCEWVFDNRRVIRVIGFDNTSKWEGVPTTIGKWGMFAIDEVIPVKDTIIDEEAYLYQLFNIVIQIVRE
ncbi:hypothetical protein [Williamsoniiplasma luminosum]|uniref:Uncharacterized protein n=1 Tax=Williamsoniiplasma luminosum TaxID=214888 RepID=A0A2S0NJ71_9MOLU|nr:hypothetical protein [Williamsoniiplasma luminosum]AVP49058.1 MAG: hypothetical protein C5T88_00460 [Williamsoniiplasma luminosum]